MRRSRPLAEAHPELLVIDTPGLFREYRVENWHLSRSRRGRDISGLPWISMVDIFSVILVGLLWPSVRSLCLYFVSGGLTTVAS
jgi:phosphatidylinositol glycan class H protein